MSEQRLIYCCQCAGKVQARLTNGAEIYPYRKDLAAIPFWRCDACKNYVGCHWKTKDWARPLGCIPNNEIKEARQHIHRLIDPVWQSKRIKRNVLYAKITEATGQQYHTANIRTVEEARAVYAVAKKIISGLTA